MDNNVARNAKPWILIDLRSSRNWNRTLKIEVVNDNLKSSPYSRIYWSALQDFEKNGKLPERFLSGKSIPVKDLFSKYNNADEMRANESLHHDHTQMLKFIYWNHNALGLRKEQFAEIVGTMSDLGEGRKVDDFRDWLKSRGDNDFLSQISASQSKLKKLFFQYAAPDHFYFDFEKFIERAKDIVEMRCGGSGKRNIFHLGQGAQHERKIMRSIIPRFMPD